MNHLKQMGDALKVADVFHLRVMIRGCWCLSPYSCDHHHSLKPLQSATGLLVGTGIGIVEYVGEWIL